MPRLKTKYADKNIKQTQNTMKTDTKKLQKAGGILTAVGLAAMLAVTIGAHAVGIRFTSGTPFGVACLPVLAGILLMWKD